MSNRIYDRELKCGCLISADKGGGVIPCHYGCGCDKEWCNENNLCGECIAQADLCVDSWEQWRKSKDYNLYVEQCKERNR